MKVQNLQVGFIVAIVGICATTLGHYAEAWEVGYGLSAIFGLIASAILVEESDDA